MASAEVVLDALGELLEDGRGGAPAAGAGGDHRHEGAEAHRLQELLRDRHLAGAVAAGLRRQRDADGVADALLQQERHRRRRGDDALGAHAGLGEAEMQGVVGARGELRIDRDQVLHLADLGATRMIFVAARPISSAAAAESSADCDDRLARHLRRRHRRRRRGVVVHQAGEQRLVERAPVDADPHRLVVAERELDQGRELAVALLAEADIAGIDAVLGERLGAGRMVGQQRVADVVEVADQRHVDAARCEAGRGYAARRRRPRRGRR